mgnify:CR=1 FL=1
MAKVDQKMRKTGADDKQLKKFDDQHYLVIKKIIAEHGYPRQEQVGKKVMTDFWTLIQHQTQDSELQQACLQNCDFGQIEKAYLTDRVLVNAKKKQIYSTQFKKVKNKFVPHPIKNKKQADSLRKEIGLKPLFEYTKQINDMFKNRL